MPPIPRPQPPRSSVGWTAPNSSCGTKARWATPRPRWLASGQPFVGRHTRRLWPRSSWIAGRRCTTKRRKRPLANAQLSLTQLIGEPSTGATIIQTALENGGKATHDGHVITLGTQEFADALGELKTAGMWKPMLSSIPTHGVDFVPSATSWGRFKDFMYRWGYSKPDVAASRGPLFRTIATRDYRYMMSIGYDHTAALAIAQEHAARQTAAIMFEIGGHTSGEHFIRNVAPFFPAWRELAKTWMVKIPSSLGGLSDSGLPLVRLLGWGMGEVRIARRASIVASAAKQAGLYRTDSRGDIVIRFPIVGDVINAALGLIPGLDGVEFIPEEFPLKSLFGIFPIPTDIMNNEKTWSERLEGVPPTLGAIPASALGIADDLPGLQWAKELENWVAPYGTDASFMGANVDNFLIAIGLGGKLPWMTSTTREFQKAMETSAILDGQRQYFQQNPPPVRPPEWETWGTLERDAWTDTVLAPWVRAMIDYGEHYKTKKYLTKVVTGMVMPFSMQTSDEGQEELAQMWAYLQPFEDAQADPSGNINSSIISTFLLEHPEMEAWMTGKYFDGRPDSSEIESFNDFVQAIKDGEVSVKSPEDFAVSLYARNSLNFAYRRREAVWKRIKNRPDPVWAYLMDPKLKDELDDINGQIADFRDYMGTVGSEIPGQTKPYSIFAEEEQAIKDLRSGAPSTTPDLTHTQEQMKELGYLVKELDKYVKLDPEAIETEKYYKMQSKISEVTASLYPQNDPFYTAVGKFYDMNADYWEQNARLYDELDASEPADDPIIYNKIRNLNKRFDHPEPYKGHRFPSPEEYAFNLRTPEEQDQKVASWATLPAVYLTQFQREQVGYSLKPKQQDKADKLATYAFKAKMAQQEWLARNNKTSDEDATKIYETAVASYASELGLSKYWAETQRPEYVKMGKALDLGSRTNSWNIISKWATDLNAQITAAGYSPSSTTGAMQQWAYAWFINNVSALHDPELDDILASLGTALSGDNALAPEQLLKKLFFGVYYQ